MPTYEYRCKRCEHHFEKLQPITANPLRTCPSCGKKTLERIIGVGGGILVARGGHAASSEEKSTTTSGAGKTSTKAGDTAKSAAASAAGSSGSSGSSAKGAEKSDASQSGAKTDSSGDSGATDSDRADWKSKATHPSREGRGLGNMGSILKGTPGGRGPKSAPGGKGGRNVAPGRNAPRRRSP